MNAESLSASLRELREGDGPLRVGEIVDAVGDRGFGLLLVILSLPSALPVPAPGYSTPFGLILAVLGIQMLCARSKPSLPGRARRMKIQRQHANRLLGAGLRFLGWTERLIRPRMEWIGSRAGRVFFGGVVLMMAILMIFPIPLTNTFPAMVIFLTGVAFCERDGLTALFAFGVGILAILLYAYVIYLLATVGVEGVSELKEWIKGLLRS